MAKPRNIKSRTNICATGNSFSWVAIGSSGSDGIDPKFGIFVGIEIDPVLTRFESLIARIKSPVFDVNPSFH